VDPRFENKHSRFKEISRLSNNFINPLKTLSEKHELGQALHRVGSGFTPEVLCSSVSNFDPRSTSADVSMIKSFPISQCQQITVKGTFYKVGYVAVLSQGSLIFDLKFGLIRNILTDCHQSVFLIVEKLESDFNAVLQTYNLQYNQDLACVSLKELADYMPLPLYHIGTQPCVTLKHGILTLNKS